MPLLADAVSFLEPGGDFIVDLVRVREAEGVQMIPRRKRFDAAETRVFQATRKDHMAVHPVLSNDESRKTHPNLERDPGFLGQNGDGAVLLRDR